jgi:hypothetical protein
MQGGWRVAVFAAALGAGSTAYAHEFDCEKRVNGQPVVHIEEYPTTVRFDDRLVRLRRLGALHARARARLVPEGVSAVKVKLTFDDAGGWAQGGSAGTLDTRVAPVRFDAPVGSLAERGRAVLLLDVGRSLQPISQEERLLLPTLEVNY